MLKTNFPIVEESVLDNLSLDTTTLWTRMILECQQEWELKNCPLITKAPTQSSAVDSMGSSAII